MEVYNLATSCHYFVILLLCYLVTLLSCYLVILLLCYLVILLSCYFVVLTDILMTVRILDPNLTMLTE
jgi:hypothetical protein